MVKLENTVTSLFSGDSGNKIPLKVSKVVSGGKKESALKNFQIPIAEFTNPITKKEVAVRTALSQYVTESKCYLGTRRQTDRSMSNCQRKREVKSWDALS